MKITKYPAYTAYINYSTKHLGATVTMVEKSAYKAMPESKKPQIPDAIVDELATLALSGDKTLRTKYRQAIQTYKFFKINRYGIYSSAQPNKKLFYVYSLMLDPTDSAIREQLMKM